MKWYLSLILLSVSVGTALTSARAQEDPKTPTETAAAYLAAIEASDLEAAR